MNGPRGRPDDEEGRRRLLRARRQLTPAEIGPIGRIRDDTALERNSRLHERPRSQGRYRIGVHFKSAAGLHKGALVYESGVVVGIVDRTQLLPDDFTVDVILALDNNVDSPRSAKFLIQAPLTGDSSLEIVPPVPAPQPAGMAAPTQSPPRSCSASANRRAPFPGRRQVAAE